MEEEIKNSELESNIEPLKDVRLTDVEQVKTVEPQEEKEELSYEPVKT